MMAKPMKALELHYAVIQSLIMWYTDLSMIAGTHCDYFYTALSRFEYFVFYARLFLNLRVIFYCRCRKHILSNTCYQTTVRT